MMNKKSKRLFYFGLLFAVLLFVWLGLGLGGKETEEEAAKLGALAPNFKLVNLAGEMVELKAIYKKNRLTLVNFWATWCPPCKREIPEFVSFYREYREQGLEILAVNAWDDSSPEQLQTFATAAEMEFPVLRDVNEETVNKYRVRAVPTTVFIDQSGQIREIFVGALTYSQLQIRLTKYLTATE